MSLALLALAAALAQAAPAAAPREVLRSTAPLSALPADIPALKRRIEEDQGDVQKLRAAVKKAQRGKNEAAKTSAREAWLAAKARLKADRALLRGAIEASEAERRDDAKLRDELRKSKKLKP